MKAMQILIDFWSTSFIRYSLKRSKKKAAYNKGNIFTKLFADHVVSQYNISDFPARFQLGKETKSITKSQCEESPSIDHQQFVQFFCFN